MKSNLNYSKKLLQISHENYKITNYRQLTLLQSRCLLTIFINNKSDDKATVVVISFLGEDLNL